MAIKKEPRINKFDSAVAELNEQEEHAQVFAQAADAVKGQKQKLS